MSATAIHSVAVDRTPNLSVERRTLCHSPIASQNQIKKALLAFVSYAWSGKKCLRSSSSSSKRVKQEACADQDHNYSTKTSQKWDLWLCDGIVSVNFEIVDRFLLLRRVEFLVHAHDRIYRHDEQCSTVDAWISFVFFFFKKADKSWRFFGTKLVLLAIYLQKLV